MKPILERYKEKTIFINVNDPVKSEEMILFLVADDYFGVANTKLGSRAYFPYTAILGVYESIDETLQINLNHFVLYKGSSGGGFMFPLPSL